MLNFKYIFLTHSYDLIFLAQQVPKARGLKYIVMILLSCQFEGSSASVHCQTVA